MKNKRNLFLFFLHHIKQQAALVYLLFLIGLACAAPYLPLGFAPNEINLSQIYQLPFQWHLWRGNQPFHWLGTDQLGRDILANIIYGARTVLGVSIPAMSFALLIGISLGSMAGYFGDKGIAKSSAKIMAFVVAAFLVFFYGFYADVSAFIFGGNQVNALVYRTAILGAGWVFYQLLTALLIRIPFLVKPISVPIDFMVLKLIELIQTVPRLLLILCLSAFAFPSVKTVILLCVFTYWTVIARLTRAEMLKISKLPYVEAAQALGFSPFRIILKHALPNMLTPLIIAFTFGLSNLMALESTLSFLSIGIPADVPSWGRSITSIRTNYAAWWTVLFPGVLLCVTVLAVQACGNYIINRINSRHA